MTPAELRARRAALGLSQAQLAARLGYRQATVSDWETGRQVIEHPATLHLALARLEEEMAHYKTFEYAEQVHPLTGDLLTLCRRPIALRPAPAYVVRDFPRASRQIGPDGLLWTDAAGALWINAQRPVPTGPDA